MNKIVILVCFVLISVSSFAQNYLVSGKVISDTKEPIFFALVNIKGTNLFTNTNDEGFFKLSVPAGKHIISVSMLGFAQFEKEILVNKETANLTLLLKEASLELEGVEVIAKTTQSKEGSSTYAIGEDAIKQIQAVSLTDIVSLLPGGKLVPQKLTSVSQLNLRTAESSSVNSFGTSIIVDGTPLSNDANLQASSPSTGLTGGTNVANKGLDLREIPASNIESVEVVTGVASAKYGNITSGAVIVTRKAGYSPLNVSFNTTPTSYQTSASRGFKLEKHGYLNLDLDYVYSINRPTEKRDYFQRINIGTRWTTIVSKRLNWNNTVALNYGFTGDGRRIEPEEVLVSNRDIKNHRVLLSNNGRLDFLGKFSYTISANATSQYTRLEQEATDGPRPLVEPLETGTYFTTFSPLSYMQTTVLKGLPLNIYSRMEADQSVTIAQHSINFSTGIEYSFDKNYGEGRILEGASAGAAGLPGSRNIRFNDIPASKTFSAYHQMSVNRELTNLSYHFRAGIRYDNMIERYNIFSPRLSGTISLFKQFKLRGAWGLSYKAPSMITLYPGPVYFDLVNLSYYDPVPAERLAIVTSNVIYPDNSSLKPSKGNTREISFEYGGGGFNFSLTGYLKDISRGISSSNTLIIHENQGYKIVSEPVGQPPVVEPDPANLTYVTRVYSRYLNTLNSMTKGLELAFGSPKIKKFKTSVNITGQLIQTKSQNSIPTTRVSNASASKSRYGVYLSNTTVNELYNSNLTIIQPITELRMMITFTTELNIYSNNSIKGASLYPVAYYDAKGDYIDIPEIDRAKPEFADLVLNVNEFYPSETPFYPNFHLQIRKETRQGHSFSFYANNCLWYNPYYTNEYSNTTSRLNSRISFGFGMAIKL
jgi:outer membrane receptor for ferrienterochelin and colicin